MNEIRATILRHAASVSDYHVAMAHAWTDLSVFPLVHRDGLRAIWEALFNTSMPEGAVFGDQEAVWGPGVIKRITGAARDLKKGAMLPPKRGVRLNHSILKGDASKVIPSILKKGLMSDPGGTGRYSESPGSLFFVAEKFHSDRATVITVDIPESWEGWAGAVNVDWYDGKMSRKPSPGATVALGHPVPPRFIVAVNGLPLSDYKKAFKKHTPPSVG